jgi:5-methylcytosine-specific restriction endonuclease McrA
MAGRSDLSTRAWKAQAARVKARDGACVDCGTTEDLTVDHLEAVKVRAARLEAETGQAWTTAQVSKTYSDEELVTRCRSHNSSKGAKLGPIRLDYRAPGWFPS